MFFKSMFPVVGRGGNYLISGIGLAGLTAATAGSSEDGPDTKSNKLLLEELVKTDFLRMSAGLQPGQDDNIRRSEPPSLHQESGQPVGC